MFNTERIKHIGTTTEVQMNTKGEAVILFESSGFDIVTMESVIILSLCN